jgi:hypothetical protein
MERDSLFSDVGAALAPRDRFGGVCLGLLARFFEVLPLGPPGLPPLGPLGPSPDPLPTGISGPISRSAKRPYKALTSRSSSSASDRLTNARMISAPKIGLTVAFGSRQYRVREYWG